MKKKLENKSRFSAVSMDFWVSEFNYLAIFFQIIKEFKAFPFLPLGLKAQRGIAIMVAVGRSVGRSVVGVQIFRMSAFFFAMAFPIDAKICTRTNLTAVSVIVRPDFNIWLRSRDKCRKSPKSVDFCVF